MFSQSVIASSCKLHRNTKGSLFPESFVLTHQTSQCKSPAKVIPLDPQSGGAAHITIEEGTVDSREPGIVCIFVVTVDLLMTADILSGTTSQCSS